MTSEKQIWRVLRWIFIFLKTSSEITNISGTYYGANGSILTLLPDKTAYKIVMVTATATVDSDNISSFELSSLNPFWENETYKRISSDTKQHTKSEYDEMINKNQ